MLAFQVFQTDTYCTPIELFNFSMPIPYYIDDRNSPHACILIKILLKDYI